VSDLNPELRHFCLTLHSEPGQYAIIANRRRELEFVAREIKSEPGQHVVVHWGHMNIQWLTGAVAYLIPAKPSGAEHLRGLRLDGAWFITGGSSEFYLSSELRALVVTRSGRPDFKTWTSYLSVGPFPPETW
jgi:hypothetical protein